ncbi:MAG: hypothetical protein IH624_14525 [Phycisphaerae bacterium]|nr:hypothetical protein [Phycisphaerae bacterium]
MGVTWAAMAACLGYMGASAAVVFLMPGLMVILMRLGVYSPMLVAGGRKERFWSGLVVAVLTCVLVTGAVTLLAVMTVLLEPVMPGLTIRGHEVAYRAIDVRWFFLPLAMTPVTLAFGLVFHRYPQLVFGLVMVVPAMLFPLFIVGGKRIPELAVDPVIAATVIVGVCWAAFAAVLRYVCMRRCLVR